MAENLTGTCLCGAIRYSVSAPISELRVCHCTNCQKGSGTGGSVNAPLAASAFKLTQGSLKRHTGKADSGRTLHRYFCGDCGSPIYSHRNPNPGFVVVRAGSLDDSSGMKITGNIWTAAARPWDHIDPSTECHPGNMPPPPPKA